MLSTDVNRRDMIKSAGIAGITAVTGVRLSPALAATRPPTGEGVVSLAAWVRMRADGGAVITLASSRLADGLEVVWEPAFSHRARLPTGNTASPWACRQDAYDTARALLVTMIARDWNVDCADCQLQDTRIMHEHSGRTIGYLIWTDFG